MSSAETVTVVEVPEHQRYELHLDGRRVGLAEYRLAGDRRVLTHSEIDPAYQGRGLAGRLVAAVVDDLRRRRLTLEPQCPFVVAYLERHPEERDVVDPDHPGGLATAGA